MESLVAENPRVKEALASRGWVIVVLVVAHCAGLLDLPDDFWGEVLTVIFAPDAAWTYPRGSLRRPLQDMVPKTLVSGGKGDTRWASLQKNR